MSKKTTEERLKETKKLEAEIKRSLSVIGVKEAHKKIEDIENLRKKSAILLIIERIDSFLSYNNDALASIQKATKGLDDELLRKKIPNFPLNPLFHNLFETFKAIRYDLQKTIGIKKEEFNKLFPEHNENLETIQETLLALAFVTIQLQDIKAYCKRFI